MPSDRRVPPQAVDVEDVVLGAMLLDNRAVPKAISVLTDEAFYSPVHQAIFRAMVALFEKNQPVDLITLTAELRTTGDLGKVGGEVYLAGLTNKISSAANIEYHAHIVLEKSLARRLISSATDIIEKAYSETDDVVETIDNATSEIISLKSQFYKGRSVSMSAVGKETVARIDRVMAGTDTCLPFGLKDIDIITGGMDEGNLIVIAAEEKRGKSTLLLQTIFENGKNGVPCQIFSTEMTRTDLMLRYAFIKEKLSWVKFKKRQLTSLEVERLKKRVELLGLYPIYVSDSSMNMVDIIAESERVISEKGVKLIAVDYIQRVLPMNVKKNDTREREIASIANGLKNIAFKYKTPLITASQLNKELQSRESRSIQHEMDKMITINSIDKDEPTSDGTGAIVGIRVQQRMGASGNFGDCKLIYDKMFGYWKSYFNLDGVDEPSAQQSIIDDPF